ncbi:N-acetylmuramoyl-L-alanine amidase family protein [Clostridium taeniosporum]|uniref:Cell wall-binding protein n=1 Tax=Clostridium taeniosporum TaxID=394958 RepID=A0A1D7XMR3_9CLOT|nr:hypothetical protein [Clostridium taeniosporum]AOR24567.1 hypothetical protein BGI42_12825 [Clostridium taeniosporum]
MNKRLKHIIATTLVVSAFTTIAPVKYINLGMVKAYASVSMSKDDFGDMVVCKGDSSKELQLYNSSNFKDSDEVKFNFNTTTYYIKVTKSIDTVNINADIDKDYEAYIFKGKDDDYFELGDEIDINSGTTTLYLRLYESGEFDEDNIKDNVLRTYKIYVKSGTDLDQHSDSNREGTSTSNNENLNDKTNNNSNTIKPNTPVNTNKKYNQWVEVNGNWQYNDSTGNSIKNKWYNDKSSGNWYYLDENGNMKTGWIEYGDSWYHLDESGAMQTGWILSYDNWYYLNDNGTMYTGWLKSGSKWYFFSRKTGVMKSNGWIVDNGKYYYFSSSGMMLSNVTINGYILGSDGAWIGR